jgi:hypothetical protein
MVSQSVIGGRVDRPMPERERDQTPPDFPEADRAAQRSASHLATMARVALSVVEDTVLEWKRERDVTHEQASS